MTKYNEINARGHQDVVDEKPEAKRIVSGVKHNKPSKVKRFVSLIADDDISNVKNYIVTEVLVPGIKDIISEVVSKGIDQLLFGGNRGYSKPTTNPYHKKYTGSTNQPKQQTVKAAKAVNFEEGYLLTREDAENVIQELQEYAHKYGEVSLADYNNMIGAIGHYTDCNYGWDDVGYLYPVRRRQGWIVGLLKPSAL